MFEHILQDERITKADLLDYIQLLVENGDLDEDAVVTYFNKYWPKQES